MSFNFNQKNENYRIVAVRLSLNTGFAKSRQTVIIQLYVFVNCGWGSGI
jgi:hypothetical protein